MITTAHTVALTRKSWKTKWFGNKASARGLINEWNYVCMNAKSFIRDLSKQKSKAELEKVQRHYKGPSEGNKCLGVRMGAIFELAKLYKELPLDEIELLLDSQYYEVRMGGVSVMDFQARRKTIEPSEFKQIYDLYIRRHDRINNWDLVDRAAPHVVGGYLFERSRKPLYKLAKSKDIWRRRTAIVATAFFIRHKDLEDTFAIGEMLINDNNEYVQKAVGSWLREAGKKDNPRLKRLLSKCAATMPRITLRYAIEKLDKATRNKLMALGN